MIRLRDIFVCMFGLFVFSQVATVAHAQSGNMNWGGWTLDYDIGTQNDGLAINNVKYQGKDIMAKGNFPSMPVYYRGNSCGPYLDRLDGDLSPVSWAGNATVVRREFTIAGEQWYELGIRQFIGNYDIYQVWYFNSDGIIDAHLFSRGLQCNTFHEHWPHWRFDFDIAGSGNDQILRQTSSGLQAYTNEFNVKATAAQNHGWVVRDTATGDYVNIQFDTGRWNVAGTIVPERDYGKNRVIGRAYNRDQDSWHTSGHGSLPADWNDGAGRVGYGNGENINNTDVVLWYSGYLPHLASEGAGLWHSTGVRIAVNGETGGGTQPPPPPPPSPPPSTGNSFTLVNVKSNKCVDVAGGATANGTNIQQYNCNGSQAQLWEEISTSGGFALRNVGSGKCLDVSGRSTANGANVHLWTCHGGTNQTLTWRGATLRFAHSGDCLDVFAGRVDSGTNLQHHDCNGSDAQSFSKNGSTSTAPTTLNLDLGKGDSPVQSGWTRVHPSTNTNVISWSGTRPSSADRGNIAGVNEINRDFVYGSQPATLNLAVGNGLWNITANMGDASYLHDNMKVTAEGVVIGNNVTNQAGEFPYVTGNNIRVSDGVLNITFEDTGGSNRHWVLTRLSLNNTNSRSASSRRAEQTSDVITANSTETDVVVSEISEISEMEVPTSVTFTLREDVMGQRIDHVILLTTLIGLTVATIGYTVRKRVAS